MIKKLSSFVALASVVVMNADAAMAVEPIGSCPYILCTQVEDAQGNIGAAPYVVLTTEYDRNDCYATVESQGVSQSIKLDTINVREDGLDLSATGNRFAFSMNRPVDSVDELFSGVMTARVKGKTVTATNLVCESLVVITGN